MQLRRLAVVAAASMVVLVACGPAGTAPSTRDAVTSLPSTMSPSTSAAIAAPTTTTTAMPTTSTSTTTTTTTGPPGPLTLLDSQPIIRGNLYTNPGAVVEVDGTLHMFRNQFSAWPGPSFTYHLTSTDGLAWEDRGVVFDTNAVPYTDGNAFIMEVVPGEIEWVGFFYTYEGTREPGYIGRATAPGPQGPWTADPEPVLTPGPEGAWDGLRVVEPTVVETSSGFAMYFAGIGEDRTSAIGMATSTDGITWVKYDDPGTNGPRLSESDPVLVGDAETWNVGSVGCPEVEQLDGGFVMMFDSATAKGYARAVSRDGITWDVIDEEPLLTPDVAPNGQPFWQSELVRIGDVYRWYLEVGLGIGPTNIFAYDVEVPELPIDGSLEASGEIDDETLTIEG